MENRQPGDLHYLTVGSQDERWGMVVTTVGYQFVPPGGSYPLSRHPDGYDFKPQSGRVLGEYQMVYITRGDGYFSSASSRRQKVSAGTDDAAVPGRMARLSAEPFHRMGRILGRVSG